MSFATGASAIFVEISDKEPVARRTRSRRTTASVATATVPVSRSSSHTRFSNVPSDTESEAEKLVSSHRSSLHSSEPVLQSIRKTATKKECTRESFKPAHSVLSFNASAVKGVSGSVQTMMVRF